MQLVPNGIWLSDGGDWVPVELELATLDIRPMHRGWDAWRVHIHSSDGRFDGLENPIQIKIRTHGIDGEEKEIILENWYIIQQFQHSEETRVTVVADVRSQLFYGKLTHSYNVEVAGREGEFRADSLNNGEKWKTVDAIQHALRKVADSIGLPNFQSALDSGIDPEIADLELPKNLSNTRYGGFYGAPYSLWSQIMGRSAHVDIVPTLSGALLVVDKHTDFTSNLESLRPRGGKVAEKDRHREQPNNLIVQFNKRVERLFSYAESSTSSAAPTPAGLGDARVENVMPVFKDSLAEVEYREIFEYTEQVVGTSVGPFRPTIRRGALRHALVPGMFDFAQPWINNFLKPFTAFERARFYDWVEVFPITLRTLYRVDRDSLVIGEVEQPLIELSLGKLNVDGSTNQSGVYMDHLSIRRYGFYGIGEGPFMGGGIYDQKFSENHQISSDLTKPSPFIAQWVSGDDDDDLLFEVRSNNTSTRFVDHRPGLLTDDDDGPRGVLKYPSPLEIIDGEPQEISEASMELHPLFRMKVFYHGSQVVDVVTPTGIDPVLHDIEFPGIFGQGTAPPLYKYVGDLTANFVIGPADPNDPPWPGTLNNEPELQERADYIRDLVLADRANGMHGSFRYSGAYVAEDVQVRGNIEDLAIIVSGDAPSSIMTFVYVAPETKEVQTIPDRLEGLTPSIIGA